MLTGKAEQKLSSIQGFLTRLLITFASFSVSTSAPLTTTTLSYEEEIFILNINVKGTTKKPNLSTDYWMSTLIEVPKWVDTTTPEFSKDIGVKLEKLLRLGFHLQQSQHFGQPGAKELPDANGNNPEPPANASLQVEILNVTRVGNGDRVQILYAVRYNGWYVLAHTVMEDLKLIGPQYMTHYLGYVWVENKPYTAPELRETSNAWIIGVVIGAVLLLLLLGWCLLFAYYNTCGRQFQLATVAATKEKLKVTEDKAIQEGSKNDYTAAPGLPQSLTSVPQKIYLTEHDVQTDPKFYENYLFHDMKHIEAEQSRDETDAGRNLPELQVVEAAAANNQRLLPPRDRSLSLSVDRRTPTLLIPKIITTQTSLDQSKQSVIQSFVDQQRLSASRLQQTITTTTDISTSLQSGAKRHEPMDLRPIYGDFRSLLPNTQSPHSTAHEIEYLYRIKESVQAEMTHPRPRISDNNELVLHTKDFWSTRLKADSEFNQTNSRPGWDHIVIGPYQ